MAWYKFSEKKERPKPPEIPCEICGQTPAELKRCRPGTAPRVYLCSSCRSEQAKEKLRLQSEASRKGRRMAEANGHKCQQCGLDPGPYKLDTHHIIPLGWGGTNDDDNLILLCEDCHKKIHYG